MQQPAALQIKEAVYTGPSKDEIEEAVKSIALELVGDEAIDNDTPLMDAGLDSLAAVELQGMLAKEFRGIQLPSTMMFDFPSVSSMADMVYAESRAVQGFL